MEVEEEKCLESFKRAFDIIDKKFPKENTEIELRDEKYGFWIKKEKGLPPIKYESQAMKNWIRQIVPENHSTEPSIQEIVSAGPGQGAVLQTESGERIHLTQDMISKIVNVSV